MSFKSFSEIYLSHRSGKGSVRWERSFEKKLMEQNLKKITVHKTGYLLEKSSLARYLTNRFQVAVRLFSNRSQRTSECGKNISDTLGCASCATFLFLPHFDVLCDLLLNRSTATWNLFVLYNKEFKKVLMMTLSIRLSSNRS